MVSGIILAAGESRRVGKLKQLLPFGNSTIIETVIDNLLCAKLDEVIVILGHAAEKITAKIRHKSVKIVCNPDYKSGMLTSVQCGVLAVNKTADGSASDKSAKPKACKPQPTPRRNGIPRQIGIQRQRPSAYGKRQRSPTVHPGGTTSSDCFVPRNVAFCRDGFLIALVDQPFLTPHLIKNLIDEFYKTDRGIVLPIYKNRRGHPVIFDLKYASEILALSEDSGGLREVVHKHQDDIHQVPVNTDSVIRDIDYWEDYIRETKEFSRKVDL